MDIAKEIEAKYLIREDGQLFPRLPLMDLFGSVAQLKEYVLDKGCTIQQGYLPAEKAEELAKSIDMVVEFKPVEARLRKKGEKLTFTLKGEGGAVRNEREVDIPSKLFKKYWQCTKGKRVEKKRLTKRYGVYNAEIDVYTDRDLIIAEIEVPNLETLKDIRPLGKNVTNDIRYKNRNLAK